MRPVFFVINVVLLVLLVASFPPMASSQASKVQIRTNITHYVPPRPPFDKLHLGMSQDSAFLVMRHIAARMDTLHVDSLLLLESDSVTVFAQPAYIQLQLLHGHIRTIVINWHPLAGDRYTGLRDVLDDYLERYFGRGIAFTNESLTYHRWETEDGTNEVSHSDKYMRVFVRLGKPRE